MSAILPQHPLLLIDAACAPLVRELESPKVGEFTRALLILADETRKSCAEP
jgi:hypothetical protein